MHAGVSNFQCKLVASFWDGPYCGVRCSIENFKQIFIVLFCLGGVLHVGGGWTLYVCVCFKDVCVCSKVVRTLFH